VKPRAVRTALVALLAGASLLAAPGPGYPAGTVVGGTPIVVQSAPWAVYLRVSMGATGSFCSGSIIDAQHVVTAAHCVYGPDGTPVPATALRIRAGISSSSRTIRSDAEQDRDVVSVRVHPGYGGPAAGSADDVPVLTLDQPLDFGGTAVQPVALPGPGTGFPAANADVGFAGFGRENPAVPATGSLNWLTARVDEQESERDRVTAEHQKALAAQETGKLRTLEVGAPLHDIGKVTISEALLRKRGPLLPHVFH